jgi:hypothetical protein
MELLKEKAGLLLDELQKAKNTDSLSKAQRHIEQAQKHLDAILDAAKAAILREVEEHQPGLRSITKVGLAGRVCQSNEALAAAWGGGHCPLRLRLAYHDGTLASNRSFFGNIRARTRLEVLQRDALSGALLLGVWVLTSFLRKE